MLAAIAVNTEVLLFEDEFNVRFDLWEPFAVFSEGGGGVGGGESKEDEDDDDMWPFEPILPLALLAFFLWLVNRRLAKHFCASFILVVEPVNAGMVALRTLFRMNMRSVRTRRFLFSSIV